MHARGQVYNGNAYLSGFTSPDTVCVGEVVNITNIPVGTSHYWNFCTADAGKPPSGYNQGNPSSSLNDPRCISLVRDSVSFYTFVTSPGNLSLLRNYYGKTLLAPPQSTVSLGNFSSLANVMRGIQVLKENDLWYGFATSGNILLRMEFGTSLMNNPSGTEMNFPSITSASQLVISKEGSNWVGFCLDENLNTILRFSFGTSLMNTPTMTNLGNVGALDGPTGMAVKSDGGQWYALICNQSNNTLTRLSFGNTLMNLPTGVNLGNPGGFNHSSGITLINDCKKIHGYVVNHSPGGDLLLNLEFPSGLGGPVVCSSLPNTGGLAAPWGLSELIRAGDTIYTIATNTGNSTLTCLFFPVCNASSIPSFSGTNPPPFSYTTPGSYNIILTLDQVMANGAYYCNPIVVVGLPTVSLGNDRVICSGNSTVLDPGTGYTSYQWSTGDTTQTIIVSSAGNYWVKVTNHWNCEASDTVAVTVGTAVSLTVDTTICYGDRYFAQGGWQTTTGTYVDTLQTSFGCDSLITTNLTIKPRILVDIGPDTTLCPGVQITLVATHPGATYLWQDGTTDSIHSVTDPGIYWVQVTVNGCSVRDTALMHSCPSRLFFPNAFTPNGDGINDFYRPKGLSIARYNIIIFDRWGQQLYESNDLEEGWDGTWHGTPCAAGVYSYKATYECLEPAGVTKTVTGTFTLVR